MRRANQARTHTADSETKQFLFQPRCAPFYSLSSLSSWLPTNVPACLPAAFTCHPPPFASNRRARWNFSGRGREKGIFLEITTEALQEEHPASKRMRQRKGEGNRVRKEENEESERERQAKKPANRQESETLAISAFVHGVQKRGERATRRWRWRRRRPSYRAEGRTRECVKRIGSRHDDPQMPLYGSCTLCAGRILI